MSVSDARMSMMNTVVPTWSTPTIWISTKFIAWPPCGVAV